MAGISKITVDDLRKIRETSKPKKRQIVFVNRRKYFMPPNDVIESYADLYRRFKDSSRRKQYAMNGSHYDMLYRLKLTKDSKALSKMRSIAQLGRTENIYLVVDNADTPDADIIIDIIKTMVNNGVW